MRTRTILLAVAFLLAGVAACFAAEDPTLGSWKLNESKSKMAANTPKNNTVVYSMDGENYKCVIDGVDASGNAAHNEWSGKFDGKDYPITGDPNTDTRSYHKKDPIHYVFTGKKAGKVVYTGTITYAADYKSRTVTQRVTGPDGKKATSTMIYEKE